MAGKIGYFGFGSAIATFIAMIISWFVDNSTLKGDFPKFKVRCCLELWALGLVGLALSGVVWCCLVCFCIAVLCF